MTEDNIDTPDIVTSEILASLVLSHTTVEIGGMGFKIRPLSWKEDMRIDKAVEGLRNDTSPSEQASNVDKARERMRLIISSGLVEPELARDAIENLPSGLFILLASKIDELSSFTPKK